MLFEISTTDTAGRFEINTKFMGVFMDKVEVIFQVVILGYSIHHVQHANSVVFLF